MGLQRVKHDWATKLTELNSLEMAWNLKPLCVCVCVCVCARVRACVRARLSPSLFIPMGCSLPAPLSMEFSKQDYWSGCHFLIQRVFLTQRLSPHLLHLPHWQEDSLPLHHLGVLKSKTWFQISRYIANLRKMLSHHNVGISSFSHPLERVFWLQKYIHWICMVLINRTWKLNVC